MFATKNIQDLCNHVVQKGGAIPASVLVLDFKKRLATQSAKWEFYDCVNALCVMTQDADGAESRFYLRACVDNGNLIKVIPSSHFLFPFHSSLFHLPPSPFPLSLPLLQPRECASCFWKANNTLTRCA
jgi:hypothetical protein